MDRAVATISPLAAAFIQLGEIIVQSLRNVIQKPKGIERSATTPHAPPSPSRRDFTEFAAARSKL